MSKLIRVTLRYDGGTAEIVRAIPIEGPEPDASIEVDDDSSGGWIEVIGPDGAVVHRQVLPDPHAGTETFTKGRKLKRIDDGAARIASVELPWPGAGARLVVHARSAKAPKAAKAVRGRATRSAMAPPSSAIATLDVDPQPMRVTRDAAAPVAVRRPIWGHANPKVLTLAFLSEGFTAAEMPVFHQMVDKVVAAFEATPPFKDMLSSLAVAEVELPSETSGISGTEAGDTPLRGHFQGNLGGRVILIDQDKASAILDRAVTTSASALVVANTTTYGGSGGAATVFSCEPTWAAEIAMHELGHSRFGLADEYDAAGQAATMKPVEPNVCGSPKRNDLKWADLVAAATPLPTQSFGGPAPADKPLGAYEGGKYRKQGIFRGAHDCKMRTPGAPFCPVCSRIIHDKLAKHAP